MVEKLNNGDNGKSHAEPHQAAYVCDVADQGCVHCPDKLLDKRGVDVDMNADQVLSHVLVHLCQEFGACLLHQRFPVIILAILCQTISDNFIDRLL